MSTEVRCGCGHRQRVAGQAAKCAACGRPLGGGVAAEPRPSAAPRAKRAPDDIDDVDEARPRSRRGGNSNSGGGAWVIWLVILIPVLLIGAGAVAVVGFCGFFLFRASTVVTKASAGPVAGASAPRAMAVAVDPAPPFGPNDPAAPMPPLAPLAPGPVDFVPNAPTPVVTDNAGAATATGLIGKYAGRLTVSASSCWGAYSPTSLVDGSDTTTWFSTTGDSVAKGQSPWVEVKFPENVAVKRVEIRGNRDQTWQPNYSILSGRLTLHDAAGKVIKTLEGNGIGEQYDFNFTFTPPVTGVRAVRFTSTKDQGNLNASGDIALGEIRIE